MGELRLTPSSQVWTAYRQRYAVRIKAGKFVRNRKGITQLRQRTQILPLPHRSATVHALESAGWYGGTTEVFRSGHVPGPVHVMDVTAAYPAVMLDERYPVRFLHTTFAPDPKSVQERMTRDGAIAVVKLETYEDTYPVRHRGYVVQAIGNYWTVLTGPELRRALVHGHVSRIGEVAWYAMGRPFTTVMRHMLSIRDQCGRLGRAAWKDVWKRMAVSLYGRFGQKQCYWHDEPKKCALKPWHVWEEEDARTGDAIIYRSLGMHVQREIRGDWMPYACPSVCAYVCSYLRERMRRYRRIAGCRDTYFRAVDCIHVSSDGLRRLCKRNAVGDGEPGLLNVRQEVPDSEYYSESYYRIGEEHVCMGVPSEAFGPGVTTPTVEFHPSGDQILMARDGTPIVSVRRKVHPCRVCHGGHPGKDGWMEPITLEEGYRADEATQLLLFGDGAADEIPQTPHFGQDGVE